MWQIEKTTKSCQNCNSPIDVSQHYFSALFTNLTPADKDHQSTAGDSRLLRRDFCANCWEKRTAAGEEEPFSFWQTIIEPPAEPPKTPREVLLNFFDNLFVEDVMPAERPAENKDVIQVSNLGVPGPDTRLKSQVKYLFALIMMRKKLLRLKSPLTRDNIRYLVLERFGDNKTYEVQEVNISDEELTSLRQEFSQLFEFRI